VAPPASSVVAERLGVATDLASVAARLRRITVQIVEAGRGVGAGVVWRRDGVIVTNAHVITSDRAEVRLDDGRRLRASMWRCDRQRDLAALRVRDAELPAAVIGDSDALRVGELVLAVGSPLGLPGAVSLGVVHALGDERPGGRRWIHADLRLAPGNSGGPLADAAGRVVGLASMIVGGLALGIPSALVERFLE
jgi:serine protease Do